MFKSKLHREWLQLNQRVKTLDKKIEQLVLRQKKRGDVPKSEPESVLALRAKALEAVYAFGQNQIHACDRDGDFSLKKEMIEALDELREVTTMITEVHNVEINKVWGVGGC